MARQGASRPKVVSSGRLTGSGRGQLNKKKAAGRHMPALEPAYSLYSTDSEDQVMTVHKGLDRCAALLSGILQAEQTETKLKPQGSKTSSSKARLKNLSRKTETDRYKHGRKTNTVTHTSKRPAPVQKKILSASSYPGLAAQPCCHSKQNPEIRLAQGSHDQLSGPTRVTQDEHAQQHSSPLTCTQAAASSSLPSSGQVKKSTIFNCRLTTSTPALSPQRPRSAHSEPCTSNCAQSNSSSGEFHHITQQWAMNAAVPSCSHGSVGTTITPTQCAASVSMAPALQLQPPVTVLSSEQNGPGSPAGQGVPLNGGPICGVSNVGPLGHSVSFPLSTGSLTCPSTSALATQAHIAHPLPDPNRPLLLCSSTQGQEICSGQSSQESGGRTSAEEEEEQVDTTPVRDISCQISQEICTGLSHKATPTSSEKTARKVMTVRYLLGELKTLVANQDSEAVRLISEVEQSISLLPVMVGSTNIQAEIALALQPLRSENVQLRRRLRILNQQLLERERAERRARPEDCNMEVDALQSMNLTLQTQLNESHKKFEDLLQENMRLRKAIEDKESDLQKNKKQCELENSQLKQEASEALAEMRLCQSKLSELEIERSALILSLQEQEAEISRLHEVIRNLQSCQTKEITESSLRLDLSQPNSQLTKSILELHENAQKESSASDKVSDTVKTYLQTLKGIGQASPPHRLHYRPQTFPPTSPGQESSIPSVSKVCSPKVTDKHKATLETIAENAPQLIEPRGITFAPLREIPVMSNVSKSLTRYNELITSKSQKESLDEDLGLKYMGRAFEKLGISDEAHTQNHLSDHHSVASQLNETNKSQDHPLQSQHARRCLRMDVESAYTGRPSAMENTLTSCDIKSDCSVNSWSTFNTRDEQNFRDGLAALDASIASLQRTLKADLNK